MNYTFIPQSQVTPNIRALFSPHDPAALRCFAVLESCAAGKIFTDDPITPSWAVLQEGGFGTLYLGGRPGVEVITSLITDLQKDGDVLFGFWHDDPAIDQFPPTTQYDGLVLEFTDRPTGEGLEKYLEVPAGCQLRTVDLDLFERLAGKVMYRSIFGSSEKALQYGFGICLMKGDQLACETYAGPIAQGLIEVGVETAAGQRGKGYATVTCANLIKKCEELGYPTYWNCDKDNNASSALARKLGYRTEKEYRLWAWLKEK